LGIEATSNFRFTSLKVGLCLGFVQAKELPRIPVLGFRGWVPEVDHSMRADFEYPSLYT
jgi:hypothetical protein